MNEPVRDRTAFAESRPALSPFAWLIGTAVVVLLLATAGRYGIFRDEYYYLMCADHPAWGYVDHPPLAMVFLKVWKAVFGVSVLALRTPPALLVGVTSLVAALLAREMRGGAAAQALAAVLVGLMPGVLALGGFYSMNPFDVAFWVTTAWIACRLLDPQADRRWWWGLGAAIGFGLLNKYSMVFLGVGLGVGLLLSPVRSDLLTRRSWSGILLALIIAAPHLVWQIRNGWPTLEFMRNAHELKNVAMGPAVFWKEQLLMSHPGFTPIWLIGLFSLLLSPRFRVWRPLGVAFLVIAVWLTSQQVKPYYMVPAYPMLLAAGAVAITGWLSRWRRLSRITIVALPVLMAAEGALIAPLAIPLLNPDDYVAYEEELGLRPRNMEYSATSKLPQHFADRFGWRELATTVSEVVAELTPTERAGCLVVTGNYGECGAINYWGLPEGTPPAVTGHNSCFTWWPEDFTPDVVIRVGGSREQVEEVFETVVLGAVRRSELAMSYEQEIPVWVCRGWKAEPADVRRQARFAI